MKIIKKDQDLNDQNEVDLLRRIRHDNAIGYFEHFDEPIFDSDHFCVVCELCEVILNITVYISPIDFKYLFT